MKIKLRLLILFSLTILLGVFSAKAALADTVTLSGNVQTSSGSAIPGAIVSVNDVNNDSATTDSSGNYSFSIPSGTYNVHVTPLSGSGFSSAVALNQNITASTILNFILTPSGTVTLQGQLLDPNGNPIPNQAVFLSGNGVQPQTTTNSSGFYSLQVAPGIYDLDFNGNANNSPTFTGPTQYGVEADNLSITQDTILNITIPTKEISVHVQDSTGAPVSGVTLTTPNNQDIIESNLSIGGGISNGRGSSTYVSSTAYVTTDSSGNATMWLFPSSSGTSRYTIVATPQTGSNYAPTTLSVSVTGNTPETIILPNNITFQGHLLDPNGNTIPNQTVFLSGNGVQPQTTTNSSGFYSFQIAPGTYSINFDGNANNSPTFTGPTQYGVEADNFSITQNTNMNITIPTNKVSVHVQDSTGAPVSGVTLTTPNNQDIIESNLSIGNGITNGRGSSTYVPSTAYVTTDTSGNATMWLFPSSSGTSPYNIIATPQSGSNYSTTTISVSVTGNTPETIILPTNNVIMQGHLYDPNGNPIPNQTVFLSGNGVQPQTTTNSSGFYSLQVTPGTYDLDFDGDANNSPTFTGPTQYGVEADNLSITQNTTLNLTIPTDKVSVHVQDPTGAPVSGVTLTTPNNQDIIESNLGIGNGITNGRGSSTYVPSTAYVTTDSSGNATMWLFPSSSGTSSYTIVATPQSGSNYSTFSLNNITVTGNQTEVVQLEYNHSTPVTTATLSPTPFSDGLYADPTTVTLSATAASGFTVANTFYTIDGGSQQTYTAPFTVTASGSHTITYWSVDNSGVTEATNTKTFTITESYSLTGTVYNDANQNGSQGIGENGYAGATVTLNTSQSTTTDSNGNYTFANLESGTYIETLTVPSGYFATTTNPADVALSANTTQNFGIAQASSLVTAINAGGDTEGSFAADEDFSGGTTYSSSSSVDTSGVTNPAPQTVYQSVRFGNFTYSVPNLTPNTNYTLRLHFNEVYFGANGNSGGVGSRVFNVSVNGTNALTNFDIYQAAGGANKAVVEMLPATSDSNGNITVQFSSVVDNAMVNGIEVDNGSPSVSPTPTPTPITSEAINAGGGTQGSFLSDIDGTDGSTFTTTADVDTTNVTNPAPESVYQSVRYGNFTYDLTNFAPNSSHTVRLHFSEPYWGTALASGTGGDGSRVFNVSINGTQVLSNFDVYQTAGGADKAVIEEFPVSADSNGTISIQFSTVTDNAMVCGIEVN